MRPRTGTLADLGLEGKGPLRAPSPSRGCGSRLTSPGVGTRGKGLDVPGKTKFAYDDLDALGHLPETFEGGGPPLGED